MSQTPEEIRGQLSESIKDLDALKDHVKCIAILMGNEQFKQDLALFGGLFKNKNLYNDLLTLGYSKKIIETVAAHRNIVINQLTTLNTDFNYSKEKRFVESALETHQPGIDFLKALGYSDEDIFKAVVSKAQVLKSLGPFALSVLAQKRQLDLVPNKLSDIPDLQHQLPASEVRAEPLKILIADEKALFKEIQELDFSVPKKLSDIQAFPHQLPASEDEFTDPESMQLAAIRAERLKTLISQAAGEVFYGSELELRTWLNQVRLNEAIKDPKPLSELTQTGMTDEQILKAISDKLVQVREDIANSGTDNAFEASGFGVTSNTHNSNFQRLLVNYTKKIAEGGKSELANLDGYSDLNSLSELTIKEELQRRYELARDYLNKIDAAKPAKDDSYFKKLIRLGFSEEDIQTILKQKNDGLNRLAIEVLNDPSLTDFYLSPAQKFVQTVSQKGQEQETLVSRLKALGMSESMLYDEVNKRVAAGKALKQDPRSENEYHFTAPQRDQIMGQAAYADILTSPVHDDTQYFYAKLAKLMSAHQNPPGELDWAKEFRVFLKKFRGEGNQITYHGPMDKFVEVSKKTFSDLNIPNPFPQNDNYLKVCARVFENESLMDLYQEAIDLEETDVDKKWNDCKKELEVLPKRKNFPVSDQLKEAIQSSVDSQLQQIPNLSVSSSSQVPSLACYNKSISESGGVLEDKFKPIHDTWLAYRSLRDYVINNNNELPNAEQFNAFLQNITDSFKFKEQLEALKNDFVARYQDIEDYPQSIKDQLKAKLKQEYKTRFEALEQDVLEQIREQYQTLIQGGNAEQEKCFMQQNPELFADDFWATALENEIKRLETEPRLSDTTQQHYQAMQELEQRYSGDLDSLMRPIKIPEGYRLVENFPGKPEKTFELKKDGMFSISEPMTLQGQGERFQIAPLDHRQPGNLNFSLNHELDEESKLKTSCDMAKLVLENWQPGNKINICAPDQKFANEMLSFFNALKSEDRKYHSLKLEDIGIIETNNAVKIDKNEAISEATKGVSSYKQKVQEYKAQLQTGHQDAVNHDSSNHVAGAAPTPGH